MEFWGKLVVSGLGIIAGQLAEKAALEDLEESSRESQLA